MNNSLYVLDAQYKSLLELAQDPDTDGEVLADTLEGLKGDISVKCDAYIAVIRQLEAECKMRDEEIAWIQSGIASRKNAITRMKSIVTEVMQTMGVDEIKGEKHSIKLVNNGGVQPLKIDGDVPPRFTKIIYEPDTKLIREAIANGESVDFAHFEPRGKHITIK